MRSDIPATSLFTERTSGTSGDRRENTSRRWVSIAAREAALEQLASDLEAREAQVTAAATEGSPRSSKAERRRVAELEQTIARIGANNIAAMIGEPIMGGAGVIIPPAGYWPRTEAGEECISLSVGVRALDVNATLRPSGEAAFHDRSRWIFPAGSTESGATGPSGWRT